MTSCVQQVVTVTSVVFTLASETPAKPPAGITDLRLKSPAKSPAADAAGGQDFPAPAPAPAGG